MDKQDTSTPQARLKQACRRLDADEVKAALALGADADAEGQYPLTIIVADNPEGGDALGRKADILKMLFGAGARKDPYYSPDKDIVGCGIEALIESAMDRLGRADWNEDAEISVLDAWLDAGNNPNPMVSVDGRIKPLIRSIGYVFDEIKQWKFDGEDAQMAQVAHYIHRLVAVLHAHGCPVGAANLEEAGFEANDIIHIMDRARAEVDARALIAGTGQPAHDERRPTPRI